MGLYLLNISIDTADPNADNFPEDLSFNDQESIIEFIVEQVLGYDDIIKEYDEKDNEECNNQKNVKIVLLVQVTDTKYHTSNDFFEREKHNLPFDARLRSGFLDLDSPPPKF